MKSIMRFLGWFFEELAPAARWTTIVIIVLAILLTTGALGLLVALASVLWAIQIIFLIHLFYYILVRDRRQRKVKEELVEKDDFADLK